VAAVLLCLVGAFASRAVEGVERARRAEHDRAELLEQELGSQREAVDALAEGLEVAVFICGRRAAVLYANRRALEMFQLESGRGRTILSATLSHELERLVLEVEATGAAQRLELTFDYPETRIVTAKAWPSPDSRVLLAITDLTDLRRMERIRQDFVANVSHELRTPMSVIRAMAETLLYETNDPELRERYLNNVIEEVDRLSLIADDLLVLGAAESNPVRRQSCDVADVFRSAVQQLARKARERGLALTYEGVDHLIVQANTTQMSQVALNLIDNALNYTSEGSVQVRLCKHEAEVVVDVADTGDGIASEHVPRIWERFYRVDKGRSRQTGGTGLGLSIVKHLVEAHGGSVSVASELNVGSTFTVRLPVIDGE